MDNKHDLVSQIKDLASELGRAPTRDEFVAKYGKRYQGGFTPLLHAAGFKGRELAIEHKKEKVPTAKEFFTKDIKQHLDSHVPKNQIPGLTRRFSSTATFGDLHFPFEHVKAVEEAIQLVELVKPKNIVQIGDLKDRYTHSKFARSHNIFTPKQEEELAHEKANAFWERVKIAAPEATCYQILGNHDVRALRLVQERAPEVEHMVEDKFRELYTFPGVNLILDPRETLWIEGVGYIHGHKLSLGDHMRKYKKSYVCGHTHRPGVVFEKIGGELHFELNVGYLGDPTSKAMSYMALKNEEEWGRGLGLIDEFGPRFIAL